MILYKICLYSNTQKGEDHYNKNEDNLTNIIDNVCRFLKNDQDMRLGFQLFQ